MGYWEDGAKLNNGKFIVEELLGSGGFGITYRIRQTRTNKLFALKTLNELAKSKLDFSQLQSKFINEAIALASCSHPNIVKVYPQGFQEEELWCMVMEYVEGKDLAKHLDEGGKFEENKAVEIITQVGEALSYVHQQGLLHRDIKPANILLRKSDSTPVLIDFGLAREYNTNPDSIRSMTNSMTECFAPIEQYQRHGKFGAWTDIYALAATLYVLITKELPFPARFREHANLVPPQEHNPQLSDHINQAIVKGLELQPEDRPQTVKAWLEMLQPSQSKLKPEPIVQTKLLDPPTIPVSPKSKPEKEPVVPEFRRNKDDSSSSRRQGKNESDQHSPTVSRRNWLKYSGLSVAALAVALIGKSILDNSDSSQPKSTDGTNIELAEYKFDVITVNDRGEEINREQGTAKYFTENLGNDITLEMVEIPGGQFTMGSPEDEAERKDNENPQREVTVSPFYIGVFEVTQAQWKQVTAMPKVKRDLESDSSKFKGHDLPVEEISWYDAVEFCKRLSKTTEREYRLPTEAEWEYACRAKTTTPFHFGETITTELANYRGTDFIIISDQILSGSYADTPKGEYRKKTTPVGSFPPNAFGLYDMHGNVWEWCTDTYQENYQDAPNDGSAWIEQAGIVEKSNVLRGGSWNSLPSSCRSASRRFEDPKNDDNLIGFRVVCEVPRTL